VHDGAVLDERPPGVEGDDAAGAALVVLVLGVKVIKTLFSTPLTSLSLN